MKLKRYLVAFLAVFLAFLTSPSFAFKSSKSKCNSPNYICVVNANGELLAFPRSYVRQNAYKNRQQNVYTQFHQRHENFGADDDYEDEGGHFSHDYNLPSKISSGNIINVDLGQLTWGAYDDGGNLVRSGHVSGGKKYCPDIGRSCRTVTGTFTIYTKKGEDCKSKIFPVGKGGAPMPYCMFFRGGYALHGSNAVPDYNASHGCVRMSPSDAEWLNLEFVRVGSTRVNIKY
ncbi:MAG: L,D-transpeptidase [Proteobacteria bacterium]|nr:L,D-transpeptidase [Pseudomonadota bacterium]